MRMVLDILKYCGTVVNSVGGTSSDLTCNEINMLVYSYMRADIYNNSDFSLNPVHYLQTI